MNTEQKKKAIQAGTHLLENDGTVQGLNKILLECFPEDCRSVGLYKYYFRSKSKYLEYYMEDYNFDNLPTIKASTFFIDEPNEPMINISLKRLEELVQMEVDNIEQSGQPFEKRNHRLMELYTFAALLKLESK